MRAGEDPETTESVEFYRFMANCYAYIPKSILDEMYEKRFIMADILRTNAKLTMKDFDDHEIPTSVHSKDLTDFAWGRGWAFVMSHEIVREDMARKRLESSDEYREEQRAAAEVVLAEASEVSSAQKLARAQEKKKEVATAKRHAAVAFKELPQDQKDAINNEKQKAKRQKNN